MFQQLVDRLARLLHVRVVEESESESLPDDNYPMW
jgi:hypothetical protein